MVFHDDVDAQRFGKLTQFAEALDAKERVKGLLKIALQGRGDQYDSKPIDTILETLEDERTRPLNFFDQVESRKRAGWCDRQL